MNADAKTIALFAVLLTACGNLPEGATRDSSPTFAAAADMAEECYAAAAGQTRTLPPELEVVTYFEGDRCKADALACANGDLMVVFLRSDMAEHPRRVEALAHEFIHILAWPEYGFDGEAHHDWMKHAFAQQPAACEPIPALRL